MEEESFALLLAIIADINTGLDLFRDDRLQCGEAGLLDLKRIDCLATRALGI
jgi:hypothetical protein